ncbi:MAG: HDOD domain-containing protein [Telluria sp.]
MDRPAAFKILAAEALRGELTFPTNIDATLKLQRALADPDCDTDTAARLVQVEPLLAARAVAIANSAAYNRSGSEITNVRAAIQRVGFRTLNALVAAVMVRQLDAQITQPALRAKANQLWQHSAHVAALAQVIARRVTHTDPDTAMFAGIVHEVGSFYVLSRAEEFPGLLDGEPEEWIEHGEAAIGRGVLGKLGVPASVMEAIESMWNGLRALPPESLGDTLLLANDLVPVPSPLHARAGATSIQSASTIDFVIGDGSLQSILDESADEVRTLAAALL